MKRAWLWLLLVGLAPLVRAHEFWLMPDRFTAPVGADVVFALRVGEQFVGEPVGFGQPVVERLRWWRASGEVDLSAQVPPRLEQDRVALRLDEPGGHRIALDTRPFFATLSGDTFNAYLREEGLDHVLREREARGTSQQPGRERYRRHVQSLVQVGTGCAPVWRAAGTGQVLEMVPMDDPRSLRPGDALRLQVRFRGQPLQGALVKLWHHAGEQLSVLRTRTDAAGESRTLLPWAGVWMASVVHMVPVTDDPAWDWDSHWGNLTFELGVRPVCASGGTPPAPRTATTTAR